MAPVVGRIRKRSTFRALARPEGRAAHGPVVVAYSQAEADAGIPLVAYVVGRSVGAAVIRNRIRRRARAAMRSVAPSLRSGAYLVRLGPAASGEDFAALEADVHAAASAAVRRAHDRASFPAVQA